MLYPEQWFSCWKKKFWDAIIRFRKRIQKTWNGKEASEELDLRGLFLFYVLLTKVRKPPVHMTDAHLGENPLFVGLRRLLSELRTKLARFACSNSGSPFWRYARPLTDFQQMLILSCAPAAFYVIGNKKCRSKPISSFHVGGGLYLSTAFFMWHIQYSRKGSSMYNKHSVGNFVHFVSIAGRLEALFERTQWASLPETWLIGGGAKWTKLPWMRLYMEEPFRTLLN